MGVGLVLYFRMEYVFLSQPLRGCDILRLAAVRSYIWLSFSC